MFSDSLIDAASECGTRPPDGLLANILYYRTIVNGMAAYTQRVRETV